MKFFLTGLLALLIGATANAQDVRFPRAALIDSSIHDTPAPIRAFLEKLKALENDGAFYNDAGMDPRDDLGGRSPKQWLIDHVAADFRCERDFGGLCGDGDPRQHFLLNFFDDEGWRGYDGTSSVLDPAGLRAVSLSFRNVLRGVDVASGEGEHCVPAIGEVRPDLDTVMTAMLGPDGAGMLEAYDNFIAVNGRYRVRAKPTTKSEVLNGIEREVVFLPAPEDSYQSFDDGNSYTWVYVVPSEGPAGFIALEPGDRIALTAVPQPQICLAMRGGEVRITAHVGAGD